MNILIAIIRVTILHIFAGLAVWLGMYIPGLDVILSVIYLLLLWQEGKYSAQILGSPIKQTIVAIFWQIPGLFLSISIIGGLDRLTEFAYYFIFMLEFWDTPLLPLVSLLPVWTIMDKPFYYYLLFALVPIFAMIYCWPAYKNIFKKLIR